MNPTVRELLGAALAGLAWGALYLALLIMILTAQDGIMNNL